MKNDIYKTYGNKKYKLYYHGLCERCGNELWKPLPTTSHTYRFCSYRCANRTNMAGKHSARWKGGRCTIHGYIKLYMPNYHQSGKDGYISEQRYVMEQKLNRPLEKNEIVHHINENKLDNRLENLKVMTRSKHRTLHATGSHLSSETIQKIKDWRKNNLQHQSPITGRFERVIL